MKNPYSGLDSSETLNLQAHIGKADYHFIKCLSIRSGIIQAVASQLWKKLADRCRLDGITDFTKEDILTEYLENLTLPPITSNGNIPIITAPSIPNDKPVAIAVADAVAPKTKRPLRHSTVKRTGAKKR